MTCLRIAGVMLLLLIPVGGCQIGPEESPVSEQEPATPESAQGPGTTSTTEPAQAPQETAAAEPTPEQQAARQKLEEEGVEFTEAAFRQRAKNGETAMVERFLAAGMDPNAQDVDGWSALFYAAESGHTDIIQALIDAGADPDLKDASGNTALTWAATEGHLDAVQTLVEGGATVDVENTSGRTAFAAAVQFQRDNIIDYLKQKGALDTRR